MGHYHNPGLSTPSASEATHKERVMTSSGTFKFETFDRASDIVEALRLDSKRSLTDIPCKSIEIARRS